MRFNFIFFCLLFASQTPALALGKRAPDDQEVPPSKSAKLTEEHHSPSASLPFFASLPVSQEKTQELNNVLNGLFLDLEYQNDANVIIHIALMRAEILHSLGRYEKIIKEIHETLISVLSDEYVKHVTIENRPRKKQIANLFVARAQALAHLGRFEEGLADIEKALNILPDNLSTAIVKIKILASIERADEAQSLIKTILGNIKTKAHKNTEVLSLAKKLNVDYEIQPDINANADALYLKALGLIKQEKKHPNDENKKKTRTSVLLSAMRYLNDALTVERLHFPSLLERARLSIIQGQWDFAKKDLDLIISHRAQVPPRTLAKAYYEMATYCFHIRNYRQALAAANLALAEPVQDDVNIFLKTSLILGESMLKLNQYAQAKNVFSTMIHMLDNFKDEVEKFDPTSPKTRINLMEKIYANRALCGFYLLERLKQRLLSDALNGDIPFEIIDAEEIVAVIEDFKQSLNIRSTSGSAYFCLADFLLTNDKFGSFKSFRNAAGIDLIDGLLKSHNVDNNATIQKILARIFVRMENYEEAQIHLSHALRIQANDTYARIQLTEIYYKQKKYNEALAMCEILLNSDGLKPEIRNKITALAFQLRKPAQ